MPIDKTLVSGSMSMLILKLLSEKDMYGYEMIDTLRKRSENVFELKAGTLYPLLHSLEDKNYLVDLDVPERSQMIVPVIGSVICSPTSLSMVLEY